MHSFTFNGHSSDEFGIRVERFPDLNRSARKFKSASVPGRNGNIYQLENAWEEVTVSYQIFAGSRTEGSAVPAFTDIMEWLHSADDYAELFDTYDEDHYRLAVFVDDTDIESEWHAFGKATIKFRCRPERYLSRVNIFPQLSDRTSTSSGITLKISKGVVSMRGTATRVFGADNTITPAFTFTSDMVGAVIALNNSNTMNASVRFVENNSVFCEIQLDEMRKTTVVTQDMVGRTVNNVRLWFQTGATARGTLKPQIKMPTSNISVANGGTVENPTNHIAKPIITMIGSGARSLLNLGKSAPPYSYSFNYFYGNLLMYIGWIQIGTQDGHVNVALRDNASGTAAGAVINSINNSTGTISFKGAGNYTGIGTAFDVSPNTDYVLSATASGGANKIYLAFFENSGNKYVGSTMETAVGSGNVTVSFRTPSNCSNALIIFHGTPNTSASYTNIMLVGGTQALPFQPHADGDTENITINGTMLSFISSGFSTAIIDCERENFTVDGANYNSQSSVFDQYGNISADYLRLQHGENAVTYSSFVTAVTVEPRFWEL